MKEKENQKLIDSYDYLSNAASTHDCTGLIPSAPVSEAELESYEDVYHYRPPRMNSSPDTEEKCLKLCPCLSFSCIFKISPLFCNILLYICKFSHCFFSIYSAVR